MTVRARMRDGTVETLDSAFSTPEDVVSTLTYHALTGSAEPLSNAWVKTSSGAMIRYGDIKKLEASASE